MFKHLLVFVAATTLAAKLAQSLNRRHQLRRSHDERRLHREDMHRWEAEGGNLPQPPRTH